MGYICQDTCFSTRFGRINSHDDTLIQENDFRLKLHMDYLLLSNDKFFRIFHKKALKAYKKHRKSLESMEFQFE